LTALDYAIERGHLDLVKLLLESGAIDYNQNSLTRISKVALRSDLILDQKIKHELKQYQSSQIAAYSGPENSRTSLDVFLLSVEGLEESFALQEIYGVSYNRFGADTMNQIKERPSNFLLQISNSPIPKNYTNLLSPISYPHLSKS
jgi:hypothetical protein